MKFITLIVIITLILAVSVSAVEYTAPTAPDSAQPYMPEDQQTFAQGLWYIIKTAFNQIKPEFATASKSCICVIAVVLLMSILQNLTDTSKNAIQLTGAVAIGIILLSPMNSLIETGRNTVTELTDYGKLLLPIMTTALAAQGGVTSSSALYTGTVFFNALLSTFISRFIIPALLIFLCICIANSALQQDVLKKIRDFIKWTMTWGLKIVLYVFTGYISITGIISGSVDASSIKAAKITISGVVPVIGNILSDATETILVSVGVVKNSVGIYGIFAILAVCVEPFIQIGTRYILLKLCGAVCNVFGYKPAVTLIEDFTTGMGFVLAMTGTVCIMLLISLVCFLRGIGI